MSDMFQSIVIILISISNYYFFRSNLRFMKENAKLVIENMGFKGELWMLRKTVEKTVPQLLEYHDQATLEAQATVIANDTI